MPRATSEVLVGTGTLYTAADGTAQPTDPDTTPAAAYGDIGYSNEGWTLAIDKDFENVEVAEEIDPIDVRKTSQAAHLRGDCAQASLEVISEAMGGGSITTLVGPPALKHYTPPASDAFVKKTVLFRTAAPTVSGAARKRDIYVAHAGATGAIEAAHSPAPDKTLVAIDFLAIKATGENLFRITDRTT